MISRTILLWPAAGRAAGQRVCCPICHFPSFPADKQPLCEKGLGLRVSYLDKNITERGKNTLTDKCSVGQSEKVPLARGRLRVYANVQKFWRCEELVVGGDTLHTEKLRNFHCNDLWPAIASVSRSSARQFRAICLTGKNIHTSILFFSRYSFFIFCFGWSSFGCLDLISFGLLNVLLLIKIDGWLCNWPWVMDIYFWLAPRWLEGMKVSKISFGNTPQHDKRAEFMWGKVPGRKLKASSNQYQAVFLAVKASWRKADRRRKFTKVDNCLQNSRRHVLPLGKRKVPLK